MNPETANSSSTQREVRQTRAEAVAYLLLRAFAGLTLAFAHGINKIPPPERFIESVGSLGFPAPTFFAWCAGGAEFLGGLLLALGLLTRPAAASIAFTMVIAGFGAHAGDPYQKKEMAFLFLAISLFFLLSGGGKFSLDAHFCRRKSLFRGGQPSDFSR